MTMQYSLSHTPPSWPSASSEYTRLAVHQDVPGIPRKATECDGLKYDASVTHSRMYKL
ncbi:hypothetical protein I79_015432 [Cricetulus griseus]|uniref:Uncharacterized protein n=1 Tax=Cricetulus griseus TaxID=10029 RepID=G3HWQ4_CRIGR|nr:hypothetical protein I79_015432 [Cricetulus griseus]